MFSTLIKNDSAYKNPTLVSIIQVWHVLIITLQLSWYNKVCQIIKPFDNNDYITTSYQFFVFLLNFWNIDIISTFPNGIHIDH